MNECNLNSHPIVVDSMRSQWIVHVYTAFGIKSPQNDSNQVVKFICVDPTTSENHHAITYKIFNCEYCRNIAIQFIYSVAC